ncbi:M23 family metallopeptidase [Streptomyces sp. NPDC004647]|uniref:M23 family metallopeptidase n=1 Tax=Streptomyces sp. NPDC004647 TaxID=3154671 RepID=UPI0033B545C2
MSAVRLIKRLRPGFYGLVVLIVVVGFFVEIPVWARLGAIVLAFSTELVRVPGHKKIPGGGTPETAAIEVAAPVTGRWSALNSPANKVPSHGTRACGQAFAIDVLREPEDGSRPAFGWWPLVRPNRDFPAFGEPALAVADATVVRARDGKRDHLSRNSYPALPAFFVEAAARDMAGPGALIGNHLILDLGDGTYALYAHLQRGSITVREGERVRAGEQLARVGNTGNSTEPHLHFQLMDSADLHTARGIPFNWRGVGVPRNGDAFTVEPSTAPLP